MPLPQPLDVRACIDFVRSKRFLDRVDPQADGCGYWLGYIKPNGYGDVWVGGRSISPHRAAWAGYHGIDPGDLTVDHLCHDPLLCAGGPTCLHRRCVVREHLGLETVVANMARGNGPSARSAGGALTCKRGHLYSESYADGRCAQCKRDRAAEQSRLLVQAARSLGMSIDQYKAIHGHSAAHAREILG